MSSVRVSICIIYFNTSLSKTILVVFIICNHYLSDIRWYLLRCICNRIPPAFLGEVNAPTWLSLHSAGKEANGVFERPGAIVGEVS